MKERQQHETNLKELHANYPVHITQTVQWGEMDALRHVNNTVYFRYFENVRVHFMQQSGINDTIVSNRIGPVLGHTQCSFLRPLTWPDTITIGARVDTVREKRFSMEYAIFSHSQGKVVATGSAEAIYVDYDKGKSVPIPAHILRALDEFKPPRNN